jgi:hypothetical protein
MGERATAEGRSGYWFPLVLLGFGLLGLLGWDSVRSGQDFGWFADAPQLPYHAYANTQFGSVFVGESQVLVGSTSDAVRFETARYPMQDFAWTVLVMATLVVTMAWYGWRARRAGGSVRAYVALAVGGGVAVPAAYVVVGMASAMPDPAGLVTSVGLPLVVLGALAGAWAYSLRPWRRTATTIGVVCLVIGVGTLLGALAPGLLGPVVIAGGLLALARFERSRLLAVAAGTVLVAMVAFPVGTPSMLIPAMVLLAVAIVALVRQSGAGAPA